MLYPLFLDLRHKRCLVFGGGAVAERKVLTLLKAEAKVTVVSREFSSGLKRLAKRYKRMTLMKVNFSTPGRRYVFAADVERRRHAEIWRKLKEKKVWQDVALAFACTSDKKANADFSKLCGQKGVWVNQADGLERSDFLVPASFKEGKLQVALSTSGLSPLLARRLKAKIQRAIGKDDIRFLNWLGAKGKRQRVIRQLATSGERKRFFAALLEPEFLRLFKRPEMARIDAHFNGLLRRFQNKG